MNYIASPSNNLNEVKRLIRYLTSSSQSSSDITTSSCSIVVVSKKISAEQIATLYQQSQHVSFGESYAQELEQKALQLSHLPLEWHFIAPLQSNKIKKIVDYLSWIHSLTTQEQATKLNQFRELNLPPLNVLIQIKIASDKEYGCTNIPQVLALAHTIIQQKQLKLRGVMGIATNTQDSAQITTEFDYLHQVFKQLAKHYPEVDTLSMGMSNDYQYALKSGSNMLRLGTIIFGARM
jgi:PLP dependent protein